jgi:hypothetical protein
MWKATMSCARRVHPNVHGPSDTRREGSAGYTRIGDVAPEAPGHAEKRPARKAEGTPGASLDGMREGPLRVSPSPVLVRDRSEAEHRKVMVQEMREPDARLAAWGCFYR